jgi:hypothetical protein
MDFKKMLLDTTDQYNYARYQGAEQALQGVADHILGLTSESVHPGKTAVEITKYIVEKIKSYQMLIESTDMGSKMNKLKEKNEQK